MKKQTADELDKTNTSSKRRPFCSLFRWCKEHNRDDLLEEWAKEKNEDSPETVSYGSIKNIWWKCKLGHEWQTTPNSRTNEHSHTGCPYCSGRRVLGGFNDLATLNPKVASEWNYEKNGNKKPTEFTLQSNQSVWWKCPAGHEFKASIAARAKAGTKCPICNAERKTSFAEKALFFYAKKQFADAQENVSFPWLGRMELDVYIPSIATGVEYDGMSWHKDSNRDYRKDALCEENGIRIIRIREQGCPDYASSSTKIRWGQDCKAKTLDEAIAVLITTLDPKAIADIDIERDRPTILEKYISNIKDNSLAKVRPDIASEWDYEKNKSVTAEHIYVSSNRKVWWRCPKCKSSYQMTVNARTGAKHSGCPVCAKKHVVKGLNDFATEHPELLAEWDYEKNPMLPDSLSSGSKKKVFWKCPKGHSYSAVVYSRTSGKTGCPYCAHIKTDGTNSFGVLYPALLEEWDYGKNEEDPFLLLPASNKKVWWKCKKCEYEWEAVIASRTKRGFGCPNCRKKKKNGHSPK